MAIVASGISPLNCRWITWNDSLPVCTRPPQPAHCVSEAECSICEHWDEAGRATRRRSVPGAAAHPTPQQPQGQGLDPLNQEACPRCGSHDVVLMAKDALVQSFGCAICHQRWLATRPWPQFREIRSRNTDS